MTEAARAARLAYQREWRRKNREKVAAQQARYWERKAAQMATAPAGQPDLDAIRPETR